MESSVNKCFSKKRQRKEANSSSSGSNYDTPQKKVALNSTRKYTLPEDYDSDESDNSEDIEVTLDTPKIDSVFKSVANMTESETDYPSWAKIFKQEITSTIVCAMDSLTSKIDGLVKSNLNMEKSLQTALQDAQLAKANTIKLEGCIVKQDQLIKKQAKQIEDAEAYSKRYNLKFYNIAESSNENSYMLLDKLAIIFQDMEIDIKRIFIDNIHRLPAGGKGPRPVIVKFVAKLDRNFVWEKRSQLAGKGSPIIIREHYNTTTEKNIRTLLPVRREAINQKKKVRLVEDRLTIDSKVYTVNNLHLLPPELDPKRLATKEIDNCLFFFSDASPLSNFHPSKFTIDGENYSCGEEYIQASKANFFQDNIAYDEIRTAISPGQMKALGRGIRNFDSASWEKVAPDVALRCQHAKFSQDQSLKEYLLATGSKKLIEAAPRDSLWGIGVSMYDPLLMSKKSQWGKNLHGEALMKERTQLRSTST